jgi:hypothetical protein
MKEQWEITQERAIATNAVWAMQPGFELRGTTLAQHRASLAALSEQAQACADAEGDASDAFAALKGLFAMLSDLGVRVPAAIDGLLDGEDGLRAQFGRIYEQSAADSRTSALNRARLVAPLWADFDAQAAAATPPGQPLVMAYRVPDSDAPPRVVDRAAFAALIADCEKALRTQAEKRRAVTNARSALRRLERRVDRDNKRWFKAWVNHYPAGTPEGDAALAQVPTEPPPKRRKKTPPEPEPQDGTGQGNG